jgi:hypothetical protein
VFAVNVDAVATPDPLVVSVSVPVWLAKVPLAPAAGAMNVTDTFGTAWPIPSTTVAWSAVVNVVLTVAVCPEPAAAEIDAAVVVFVRLNDAAMPTPLVDAVTV